MTDLVVENFTIVRQGYVIDILYKTKKVLSFDSRALAAGVAKDIQTLLGEAAAKKIEKQSETDEANAKITAPEVQEFAQAYCSLIKKYTGQTRTYTSANKKIWPAMVAGARAAKEAEIIPLEYIEIIVNYYSRINTDDRVTFPFPNQLHGPTAENIILSHFASVKGNVSIENRMRKLARSKKYVPLNKDEYYIECREKFKSGDYGAAEIEYVKIRQIQIYGEPKEWLMKYQERLDARQ